MQAKSISTFRLYATIVLATLVLHGTLMVLNQMLFGHPEFLQGNGWTYLSACTRLLYTLLSCGAGATGLSVAGWIACYWYYNPADALRAQAWRTNTSGRAVITHTLWLPFQNAMASKKLPEFAINASSPERC
jgi:hypothetical protein